MIPIPLPFACCPCLPHPCACRPCFLQLQLQEATYTPETVEVLRRVAGEVQTAVGTAETRLQQVRLLGGGAKVGVLGACPCLLWAGRLLPMFAAGSHLPPSWKPAAALWRTSEHPCTISDHFWVGFTCSTARFHCLAGQAATAAVRFPGSRVPRSGSGARGGAAAGGLLWKMWSCHTCAPGW